MKGKEGPGRRQRQQARPANLPAHAAAKQPAPPLAFVALSCYCYGMARVRVSTTVDSRLLESARRTFGGLNDATLLDAALDALLARERAAELDASYVAYDKAPLDTPDEWGDLASFREAAARS